jgi:hypothetical protein
MKDYDILKEKNASLKSVYYVHHGVHHLRSCLYMFCSGGDEGGSYGSPQKRPITAIGTLAHCL